MNDNLIIGILAAAFLYVCFHIIRQRRIRRNEIGIPPFLRGGDYPINDGVEDANANNGAYRAPSIGYPPGRLHRNLLRKAVSQKMKRG